MRVSLQIHLNETQIRGARGTLRWAAGSAKLSEDASTHGQPTRLSDSVLGRVPDRDQGEGLAGLDSNRASLWLDFKLPGANV